MNGSLDFGLKDKVAIVAGGGAVGQEIGNGRAASILLADAGAKVLVADKEELLAKNTFQMIKDRGGEAKYISGDLTKSEECKKVVDFAISSWGRLDILDNNIGIASKLSVVDETEENWDHVMDVNLKPMFLMSKYAIPELCENRFYFYDFECPETVGTVTSSWREKYVIPNVQIENFFDWEESKVLFSNPDENIVLCAFYAHLQKYENQNKYFEDLLYDLELQDLRNTGVWANQIICKREIFQELKEFMIEAIIKLLDLHKKCDLFSGPQHSKFNLVRYNNRGLGLLAEEISARWFCNREDVTLIEVQKINPSWYH